MGLREHLPSGRQLALAAGIVVLAGTPIALSYVVFGGNTASSVYRGMTCMLVALTRLELGRKLVLGALTGVVALVGWFCAGSLVLLVVAVILACLAQAVFNCWSIGTAAVLPPAVIAYSNVPTERPVGTALGALAGAGIAIGASLIAHQKVEQTPVPRPVALTHAVTLAAGCVALLLATIAVGLPHGSWAVLTVCLVYLPAAEQTRSKMRERTIGTVAGAVVAAAVAVEAPRLVCLALAVPCAFLAVAFALMPEEYLGFVAFMTPTIILLYGAAKHGWDVVGLAGERIGLTVLAGVLALVFNLVRWRPLPG